LLLLLVFLHLYFTR